jgi:lipoate-protein ligase A
LGDNIVALFDQILFWDDRTPRTGPWNMAFDEVMSSLAARRQIPVLRSYQWLPSWISFGYFQRFPEVQSSLPPDVAAVRRLTGGGTVDHRWDQTYSLTIPRTEALTRMPTAESYLQIHAWLATALNAQGIYAETIPSGGGAGGGGGWCFVDEPVAGDLGAFGHKIAGAAQRRTRLSLLHQGSIQFPVQINWMNAANLLADRVIHFHPGDASEEAAESLMREKYGSRAWLQLR